MTFDELNTYPLGPVMITYENGDHTFGMLIRDDMGRSIKLVGTEDHADIRQVASVTPMKKKRKRKSKKSKKTQGERYKYEIAMEDILRFLNNPPYLQKGVGSRIKFAFAISEIAGEHSSRIGFKTSERLSKSVIRNAWDRLIDDGSITRHASWFDSAYYCTEVGKRRCLEHQEKLEEEKSRHQRNVDELVKIAEALGMDGVIEGRWDGTVHIKSVELIEHLLRCAGADL